MADSSVISGNDILTSGPPVSFLPKPNRIPGRNR